MVGQQGEVRALTRWSRVGTRELEPVSLLMAEVLVSHCSTCCISSALEGSEDRVVRGETLHRTPLRFWPIQLEG